MNHYRREAFPFNFEPNGIKFASKLKENCHLDNIPNRNAFLLSLFLEYFGTFFLEHFAGTFSAYPVWNFFLQPYERLVLLAIFVIYATCAIVTLLEL